MGFKKLKDLFISKRSSILCVLMVVLMVITTIPTATINANENDVDNSETEVVYTQALEKEINNTNSDRYKLSVSFSEEEKVVLGSEILTNEITEENETYNEYLNRVLELTQSNEYRFKLYSLSIVNKEEKLSLGNKTFNIENLDNSNSRIIILNDQDKWIDGNEFETNLNNNSVLVFVDEIKTKETKEVEEKTEIQYELSAEYKEDSENVGTLNVSELDKEDERYNTYFKDSYINVNDKFVKYIDLFELNITKDEEKESEEFEALVKVKVNSDELDLDQVGIVKINNNDIEFIESEIKDKEISFNLNEETVFALVEYKEEKTLSYSGSDYLITVVYDALSNIDYDAELKVSEIKEKNNQYDDVVEKASEIIGEENVDKAGFVRAFDIAIINPKTNEEYEPNNHVKVTIDLLTETITEDNDISVVHIKNEENTEVIDAEVVDGSVEFNTSGFSIYVVVSHTLDKVLTASDGNEYLVTVKYDETSGIPENAELIVTELKEGDEGYNDYIKAATKKLGSNLALAKPFDITLTNPDTGDKYQPSNNVKVSIKLLKEDINNYENIDVIHFAEEADGDVQIMNTTINGETVEFKTDGFSVYVLTGSNNETITPQCTFTFNVPNEDAPGYKEYSFKDTQGNTVFSQTITSGDELVVPQLSSMDNKFFAGWYKGDMTSGDLVLESEPFDFNNITITENSAIDVYAVFESYAVVYFHNQFDSESGIFPIAYTRRAAIDGSTTTATIKISDFSSRYVSSSGESLAFNGWSLTPITTPGSATDDSGNPVSAVPTDENGCIEVTGETHLYPIFIETYLLTFYAAETGQGAAYNGPRYLNKGEFLNVLPITSLSGNTFKGWYTGSLVNGNVDYGKKISNEDGNLVVSVDDGGVYVSDYKLYLRSDTTLYAKWEANTKAEYKILYWKQNGNSDTYSYVESITKTGTIGETATVADYEKENDRYDGFHLKEDPTTAEIKADGSTVLHVYYDYNDGYVPVEGTYTLTFADSITEEGKTSANLPQTIDVTYNATITAIDNPASGRKGYTFSKWYLDPYGIKEANLNSMTMPDHDLTLYAGWEVEWYVVNIDPNYGELRPLNDQGEPTGTGSTFFWQTVEREPVAEYTYVERNYVESSSGTYYYVFHHGDGKGNNIWSDRYTYYTQDITKATEDTTFEYSPGTYTYAGWYEVLDDGTEVPYVFGERTDHNTNLRLHWKKNGVYYLKYNAVVNSLSGAMDDANASTEIFADGIYADCAEITINHSAIAPTDYTFVGWKVRGSDSNVIYKFGQTFTLDAEDAERISGKDIVYLDAVYTKIDTASIIYDANGGTVANSGVDFGKVPGTEPNTWIDASGTIDQDANTATVSGLANNSKLKLSDGTGFTAPVNSNAEFLGWSDKAVCDDSATFFDKKDTDYTYGVNSKEPKTLYAVWGSKVTYYHGENAQWGEEPWDSTYTFENDTYSLVVKKGNLISEPINIPVYTGDDGRVFRYWATRSGSGTALDPYVYTEYDFSQPVTSSLDLYAYWATGNTVVAHAIDSSSEALVDKTGATGWTTTNVIAKSTPTELNGTSHVTTPEDYEFAFVAVSNNISTVSESNAVTEIKYENKQIKVKYAGGSDFTVLDDGSELYFVYYKKKELNIGYKNMAESGELINVTATGAPTTTGSPLLGEYDMSTEISDPLSLVSGFTNYAFAIGDVDSGAAMNASNLSLITDVKTVGDAAPTLRIRNTWRGFQYTTEVGNEAKWTNCGYNFQLYVIYYTQTPTVVLFTERTIGASDVMETPFIFNLLVTQTKTTITSVQTQIKNTAGEWVNSGDPVVTEVSDTPIVIYDTTAEGNQPYVLKNGETNSAILFYSSSAITGDPEYGENDTRTITTVTTEVAQTAVITQVENSSFTTKVKEDGGNETETLTYTCVVDGSGGTKNVTFTNTHIAHTIEVHVAMVENNGNISGIFQRDNTMRSTTKYSFDVALGETETILTELPSNELFKGDLNTYAFGAIVSGREDSESVIITKHTEISSISYEQVSENKYELVLKDSSGAKIAELGNDRLYYIYYPMPQIRYVKEATDGTLTDITGSSANAITYSHQLIEMNGMTVVQNQKIEIPLSGLIISQSGNNFRMPPVLDNDIYERYLGYTKIGAGNGDATNSSQLDLSLNLEMQLKVKDNSLQYSFDGTTWKDLLLSGMPTIYAIYSERGYDLQISKTVDMSQSGVDTLFSDTNFTVTISSTAITKDSYKVEGYDGSTITATPAVGSTPGTITLNVMDGTKVRIKGLGLGEYTITESRNENYTLTAKSGPIVGGSTTDVIVVDNTTVSLTLDSEKKVDLVNSPKQICKIGNNIFYSLRSMIDYVDNNISTYTATAEMLTDYLMPTTDTVEIPSYMNITLTTANSLGHVAVITRRPELANEPLFVCNGTLAFESLTIEGNNLTATAPMISSAGNLTIGLGATIQNVVGGGAIKATAGDITVSGTIENCSAENGGAIYHTGNGTITMNGAGTIQNNTATSGNGGAIWLAGGMVNVSGNSLITNNTATSGNGGAIYCANNVVINIDQAGSIASNEALAGGAIYVDGTGIITISQTENVSFKPIIENNTATSGNGGAIYANNGSVSISGGTLSNNKAESGNGGAVYTNAASVAVSDTAEVNNNTSKEGGAIYSTSGSFTISGGTVKNNIATSGNGGAIYAGSGNVTMSGGSLQNNNSNTGSGGAIYAGSGNITISGGALSENTANISGGAVYAEEGSITVNAESGTAATIQSNTATTGSGGALYAKAGAVSVSDTTLEMNTAGTDGGAIYATSGIISLTNTIFGGDASTDGNIANGNGGAIYAESGNLTISGGSLQSNNSNTGNGGAIYAGNGVVTLSSTSMSSNSATSGNGGAIYLDSGSMTLMDVTATSNSAINGSAIYTNDGKATFSAGSYTENNASNGGAVGIGSSDARLFFSGNVQIKNNKLGTENSNVYLDQDDDAVINIDSLGGSASIGIYVKDSVLNTRGVPGARFANYTDNTNVSKITNDRHAPLRVRSDTASKKLYWGNEIKVSLYALNSYDSTFTQPEDKGTGAKKWETNEYYPEFSDASISELATELVNKYSIDIGTQLYAAAYVDGTRSFGDYITKLTWHSDVSQWFVTTRSGEEISMTKSSTDFHRIYIYFVDPAYISIENNTDMILNISDMKVDDTSVINSTTVAGYGMTFAKNGAIRPGLLPVTAEDMVLGVGQSITLLIPGGRDKSYTIDGKFVTDNSGSVRLRRTDTVESTLAYDNGTITQIAGSTLNSSNTYQIILGDDKNICKVVDADGVEHPYSKINDALTAIKDGSITLATANTAVVEMLVDYLLPASDHVLIPRGYDITLTTASTSGATYNYQGESTDGRAIISRDLENKYSMIDAWNSAWNPNTGTGTDNVNAMDNTTLRISNLVIDGKSVKGNSDGGAVASKYVNVYVDNVDFKNVFAKNGGAMLIMFSAKDKQNKATVPDTVLEVKNSNFIGCTSSTTETSNRLGGGAIVTNAETMRLENSIFDTCTAVDQAGAVFHRVDADYDSWSYIYNCTFTNCSARAAGGLELDSKTIEVKDSAFEHCVATERNGGGFNVWSLNSGTFDKDCWVTVTGTTFNDCQVTNTKSNGGNGGGFRSTALYTKVENCTFTNNTAYYGGGFAVSNTNAKKVEIYGSSFERNNANLGGGMRLQAKEIIIGDYTDSISGNVRHTEIKNCNSIKESGGGILHDRDINGSSLTITNAIITGNEVKTAEKSGGGVFTYARTVEINGTTISDNVATNLGGGLYARSYTSLTITDSNISRNTANGDGGGVWFDANNDTDRNKQVLTIKGSAIDSNSSNGKGGGVYTQAKTVTVGASETRTDSYGKPVNSSISNNTASGNGGGIYQSRDVDGSILTIANTNINNNASNNTNNSTENGGGGVYARVRTLKITKSDISNNTAKSNGGGVLFEINNDNARNAMNLTVEGSTLNGNTSNVNGGGIYTKAKVVVIKAYTEGTGESATVTTSSITNCNAALSGGGVYQNRGDVEGSKIEISNTTISGCASSDTGTNSGGGGVYANVRDVAVTDSTISNNTAVRNGGGIYAPMNGNNYKLILDKATITGNSTGNQGGGVYTRSQLTLRNNTEITNNHLTTNTVENCAGVYLINNRTLFIGDENAAEGASDTIVVRGNTTANGTLSDLRLWDDGKQNNSESIYVYCNLVNSEIRVVNAAKAGIKIGNSKYALTNGFSDDNYVFIADNSTLHAITDRGDTENKTIIWVGPPIVKLTDGIGRLLYMKYYDGSGTYPAIFDRLDTGNYSTGSSVSPFSLLRMSDLTLYYRDGTEYTGTDYCIKMLVEQYETSFDMALPYEEGRTVTFTTAEKNFPSDWAYTSDNDIYHFEGKSGERATVIRGSSVSGNRTLMNIEGNLILENIIIDGGKENGVTSTGSTRCMYIDNPNITVTLKENAVLQNGKVVNKSDGGGVYVKQGNLNIEGGVIRNCYAQNDGGGVFFNGSHANFTAGSIYQCEANGSGGGVRIKSGNFAMTGGTIQGCKANNGGGIYVAGGGGGANNLYMSGGSIIKNNATSTGGGIAVWDATSRIYFSGKVNVSGNTKGAEDNAVKCNVELNKDSNNVINTNNGGLFPGAYIGVYVDDANYGKHGQERKPFGTFATNDNTTYLYSFINDRNGLKGGVIDATNTIYWIQIFSLEITNNVVSGGSTTVDPNELFLYKVNVRGKASVPGQKDAKDIDSRTSGYGEMQFISNGIDTTTAVFGLIDGQTILGVNLSEGLSYEVIEYLTVDQAKRYASMPMNASDMTVETITYNDETYDVVKANTFTSKIGENKGRTDIDDPYTSALTFNNLMAVCKITDKNGNLLYQKYDWEKVTNKAEEGMDGGSHNVVYYAPAVYTELTGDNGAFKALEGTLYSSNGSSPTSYSVNNGIKIQMLIDTYNLGESLNVDNNKGIVTLTTAATTDTLFPKQDSATTTTTILRAFSSDSMFKVSGGGVFTLTNITLDGAKSSYTINKDGGIVNVASGAKLYIQDGASLLNSKTNYKGGAVYVDNGATVYMTGGTIDHNESIDYGAGVYLAEGGKLYLSGSPNFGGTGTNVSGNITTSNGNFRTNGYLVAQKNGGKTYLLARQDIYIAGYHGNDGDKNAVSLIVNGDITSGDGTIWVWAAESPHYKFLQQFAKIDSGSAASLRAFRNARPDSETSTSNVGHYMFGFTKDDMKYVFWSGSRHVILRKSASGTYAALSGAMFDIYTDSSETNYAVDNNGNPMTGLTSDSNGIFYVGDLGYGTYYVEETTPPAGYNKPADGYYFIITVDETGVGYKYKEGGTDKIRRDVYPTLPS